MPSDITGPTRVDRPLPPPTRSSGVGGVSSSQAVVRVTPVDPQQRTDVPSQLLGRSGLDLYELLATNDLVTPRPTTGNVALDVGLEQARSALLRNLPGDALAALDGVWDAARRTEEGWYLRSGALLVLGLPGEGDRVATDGLTARPQSSALRFIQSLARLVVNDAAGARVAIQEALQRVPNDPTLLVQQALVQAKQGNKQPAISLFADLQTSVPDHPALAWGRAAMKVIVAEATRQQSRPTPVTWPTVPEPQTGSVDGAIDIFPEQTGALPSVAPRVSSDVATAALERFGASIASRPMTEIGREARLLLRAFSAGGTLVASATPEQAHAARVLLSAVAQWASGDVPEIPSPMHTLVTQLVPLVQHGRLDEAQRLLRRQGTVAREPIGRLLMSVLMGADQQHAPDGATARSRLSTTPVYNAALAADSMTPGGGVGVVREDKDRGAVVPIRLGLALLEESAPERKRVSGAQKAWSAMTGRDVYDNDRLSPSMLHGVHVELAGITPRDNLSVFDRLSGRVASITSPEERGLGWGAARAAAESQPSEWSEGAGMRAVALVCVVLAAGTLIAGYGAFAIALAVGAAWLGLRRSGREGSRSHATGGSQSGNEPERSPETGNPR